DDTPTCKLCHKTDAGGPANINDKVGAYLTGSDVGLVQQKTDIDSYLDKWDAKQDSDDGGEYDVDELKAGHDPNDDGDDEDGGGTGGSGTGGGSNGDGGGNNNGDGGSKNNSGSGTGGGASGSNPGTGGQATSAGCSYGVLDSSTSTGTVAMLIGA